MGRTHHCWVGDGFWDLQGLSQLEWFCESLNCGPNIPNKAGSRVLATAQQGLFFPISHFHGDVPHWELTGGLKAAEGNKGMISCTVWGCCPIPWAQESSLGLGADQWELGRLSRDPSVLPKLWNLTSSSFLTGVFLCLNNRRSGIVFHLVEFLGRIPPKIHLRCSLTSIYPQQDPTSSSNRQGRLMDGSKSPEQELKWPTF